MKYLHIKQFCTWCAAVELYLSLRENSCAKDVKSELIYEKLVKHMS